MGRYQLSLLCEIIKETVKKPADADLVKASQNLKVSSPFCQRLQLDCP